MFTPQHYNTSMPWPRPFVVGFLLLLLFLSLFGESPSTHDQRQPIQQATAQTKSDDGLKKGVKEQIIYDLSVTNERLENEVQRLKQYILDVRRAMRKSGCPLEDNSILTLYPELHDEIKEGDSGDGKDESTSGSSSKDNASSKNDGSDSKDNASGEGEEDPASNASSSQGDNRKLHAGNIAALSEAGTSKKMNSNILP